MIHFWTDHAILFNNDIMHESTDLADRRVAKTVASLRLALTELIIEKHYDTITVQDIIDRANVGRSTFYTHFRDKEDLLIGDWKKFLGLIAAHIDIDGIDGGHIAPIEGLMMHLKDYHAFYRALVRSGKIERLFATGIEHLAAKIEEKVNKREKLAGRISVPPAICSHYLALQIFGLLKWWLDHNMPYPPAEMDRIFHALVGPGMSQLVTPSSDTTMSAAAGE